MELGLERDTAGSIEQHVAGSWHSAAMQESIEFGDADVIKSEFHIASFRWSSILFNKITFEPDLEAKSLFLPGIIQYCKDGAREPVITKARFPPSPEVWKSITYNDVPTSPQ